MQKISYPNLFNQFVGREEALKQVIRYHIYSPMFYRSQLATHAKHVLWLYQTILPLAEQIFGADFDSTKAQLLAVVHDDPETIMGDIVAGHKKKMTMMELAAISEKEQMAIAALAERYPFSILGYNYGDLMREGQALKTPEAKLLKYVDRFDALGEALHELFAGNAAFATSSVHEKFGVIDMPVPFYQEYIVDFLKKNPEFIELFQKPHPLFAPLPFFDTEAVLRSGHPHSLFTLRQPSDFTPYEFWKKTILDSGDEEEIQNLYRQKESD